MTVTDKIAATHVSAGTILVVDDNEMNRDLLSRRLRRDGHTVVIAEHGRAALDALAREPYDLVLLDIMMPELTGYEVLEIMKKDAALQHIPVVMITAATEEDSIVRCLLLGADDHLPTLRLSIFCLGQPRGAPKGCVRQYHSLGTLSAPEPVIGETAEVSQQHEFLAVMLLRLRQFVKIVRYEVVHGRYAGGIRMTE